MIFSFQIQSHRHILRLPQTPIDLILNLTNLTVDDRPELVNSSPPSIENFQPLEYLSFASTVISLNCPSFIYNSTFDAFWPQKNHITCCYMVHSVSGTAIDNIITAQEIMKTRSVQMWESSYCLYLVFFSAANVIFLVWELSKTSLSLWRVEKC
jgi:hypothetical protein